MKYLKESMGCSVERELKSKCCNADVKVEVKTTLNYVCTKCSKFCDVVYT